MNFYEKYLNVQNFFLRMIEGGGFDPGDKIPSEADNRLPVRTDDTLVPVTIKQILDANPEPGKPLMIDGVQRKIVSICGLIVNVSEENISIVYDIDDGTGVFRVQDFTQSDSMNLEPALQVHTYAYVCGRINTGTKDRSAPPYISAFKVKPVEDFDQIPYHTLQALYVHKYMLHGLPKNSAFDNDAKDQIHAPAQQQQTTNQRQAEPSLQREEMVKKAVLDYIRAKDQTYGVHQDQIAQALSNIYSVDEVLQAIEALNYGGEIYSAAEADHYACC
ncbi:hypothetical protein TRFO_14135 [Tritrichomonas foetus]|uniref:Replication protein A C-terminal domain-containing protein n=1 Tax=Tritrichomonas foetus TaxID=1144522 RepID=A0A1J4KVX6_9EUKA|nr:hypothetical protein TRFO_14135 [Tritrichomonas foetus]|eukprot:OHT15383.1 hypothetical protein TRFO_14135 [Tritrichomonas foetus]